MAILIRTKDDQSFWIEVEGSWFKVRPLRSSEESALQNKYTKPSKGGFPKTDTEAIKRDKFKKTVLYWENVQDIDGNDVPYSDEIRDKFAELNPDYAWYIVRQAENHNVAAKENETKNLGESQSGERPYEQEL